MIFIQTKKFHTSKPNKNKKNTQTLEAMSACKPFFFLSGYDLYVNVSLFILIY